MATPSQFALSSKRWRAGLAGMLLMVAVSMPWLGIPPDVAEQLREFFAAIVISFIAGQTVTDVVTKGRTSGSFAGPDELELRSAPELDAKIQALHQQADDLLKRAAPPADSGRAALPALILALLAGAALLSTASCSSTSTLGRVAASEERVAQLEYERDRAAADLQDLRGANGDETATPEQIEAADHYLDQLEIELDVAREEAREARQRAAETAGTASAILGPGLGQVVGPLALLLAAGAAEYGRTRALKRAATDAAAGR